MIIAVTAGIEDPIGPLTTASHGELRIGYRDLRVWFWPVFWPVALAVRWTLGTHHTGPMILWVLGIGLLETNAILTARRARRGLTLAPDGVTWHKYAMFLPWSIVTAVEQSAVRRGHRLVVRVSEPGQALEDVARPARLEVRSHLRRYGAPVALRAGRLAVPAAEVVEVARRLREEQPATDGLKRFMALDARPERVRAHRSAKLWARLAAAGVGVLVFAGVVHGIFAVNSRDPQLAFVYRQSRPGYIDQILTIINTRDSTVAPTLEFVPLDRKGRKISGVTVRTALGSDHGMVVVPAGWRGNDVLAFDGPGFRQVADVKVIVRSMVRIEAERPAEYTEYTEDLQARTISAGHTVQAGNFDTVLVNNPYSLPISIRVVCIISKEPSPGAAQQMVEALPIGDLTRIEPLEVGTVPVTGPAADRTRECGEVMAYLSR
jgi:hypothetical protein